MAEQLLLATEKVQKVQVRPLVVFQILDRFLRRSEGQERVIGTLLGTVVNGVVEITNSFPVPHLEKDDDVAIGKDFHKQMHFLHSRVNSTETIIGWYATSSENGALLNEHSCLIHDFYASECDSPIHVVVDTSLKNNDQVQVKAFLSSALSLVECALTNQFKQLPVTTKIMAEESIALDIMSQNRQEGWTSQNGNSSIPSDLQTLEKSIQRLEEMVENCLTYVQDVVSGRKQGDAAIGRALASALMSIPDLNGEKFDKIFNNSLQDLLMINYLSTLTQTQLSLSEKLLI